MSTKREAALNLATELLTADTLVVDALDALSEGRDSFIHDYTFTEYDTLEMLDQIADQACEAWMACRFAGLTNLSDVCERIDLRIRQACVIGRRDANPCLADLSKLTTAGRELLDIAEYAMEPQIRQIA